MFKRDIDGIIVNFNIKGYKPSTKENWDTEWCNCDFSITSGEWLNYNFYDNEILLMCEVEELESMLSKLLNDEITEYAELSFIEPDFEFKLYPKTDIRNNPSVLYVKPGCEISDILLEWQIHFWDGGLTANYLTITLDREDILLLRDSLLQLIKNKR